MTNGVEGLRTQQKDLSGGLAEVGLGWGGMGLAGDPQ